MIPCHALMGDDWDHRAIRDPLTGDADTRTGREAAADDGALHQLAWTRGADALRTRWKLIGVCERMCGKVRGGACLKAEDEWCS